MALVEQASDELESLFGEALQARIREVFRAIPGTTIKYLEQKSIIKKLSFRNGFAAEQVPMGTRKKVNFVDFERALRQTIQNGFDMKHLTEVRSEDLSQEISKQYQNKNSSRALPGESVQMIIRFDTTFTKKDGEFWTIVKAHVYAHIEEECENNWFAEDKRKFKYELSIELNGVAVNKDKAIKFSELIMRSTAEEIIMRLTEKYAVTWDDL